MLSSLLGFLSITVALASPGSTLRVQQSSDFVTLDWTLSSQSIDTFLIQNLQEGLFKIDEKLQLKPALGLSVTKESGGTVIKIPIRTDVVWSDGVPLTAQHFLDAWKRLLSPLTGSPYAYLLFDVEGAEEFYKGTLSQFEQVGLKAPRKDLIEIKLKRPSVSWIWVMTFRATYPIRMDVVRKHGSAWTKPGKMVNLGAYTLESVDFGKSVSLKRNPKYYGNKPAFERVEVAIRAEASPSSLNAFKSGQIDFAAQFPAELRANPKFKSWIARLRPIRTKRLTFNVHDFPTSDPNLRAAIFALLDRSKLASELGVGYAPAGSLVPPGFLGHRSYVKPPESERFKALKSLQKATQPYELTILVPVFGERQLENRTTAQSIRRMLESTGSFKVKMERVESSSQWNVLSRSRNFSMILHDWTADYPDSENFYELYTARSKHAFRWINAQYDRMIDETKTDQNGNHRNQTFEAADRFLIEQEKVVLPLYYAESDVFRNPSITLRDLTPFFAADVTRMERKP